jgi:CRP-like cAMP-binding protein
MVPSQADFRNFLISRMDEADFERLQPDLRHVDLPLRKVLERRQRRTAAAYFPESGFASVVANGDHPIEIGIVGREGMTGLSLLFGDETPNHDTYIQAAGKGICLDAHVVRRCLDDSPTFRKLLLRYAGRFQRQTAETAIANGRSKIEERLARWLLMADDRIDGGELPLTHEFLAMMLGVRRPGVTVAVQALEKKGIIARRRGHLIIIDREALEAMSNGTYSRAAR